MVDMGVYTLLSEAPLPSASAPVRSPSARYIQKTTSRQSQSRECPAPTVFALRLTTH